MLTEKEQQELFKIHDIVDGNINAWSERTGKKKAPPYPADAPCYYCIFNNEVPDKTACNYCIQNPKAVIYGVIK